LQDELVQARDQVKIEADARIEQIKFEADERVARAEIEVDARIEQIKIEADNRVARAEAEAKQYLDRRRVEIEDDFSRLKADLAQAELRADCAEKWLVLIRREIDDHLMPSFAAMHDRLTSSKIGHRACNWSSTAKAIADWRQRKKSGGRLRSIAWLEKQCCLGKSESL
jgi:hypothetical protein